ncbi:CbtB-domain containing protein [Phormidium sp. LEGE 05292]|uniref:CbtB-domain containing protein n=1 Tax=[Phormidium] sp. LEGE 05292 TaxID=767427 RepID=UPI0018817031|nr:CbtB-domain containing protein [Phormidium sp. LEGE 05292]MBE9226252.1 CbtB-domain containing protein [Phormidium sp. LEGE 05292]
MTTRSLTTVRQQAVRFTLSMPVQATLYVSLCSLVLWTIYFTTYPAIHDRVHSLRHHTAGVACH